MSETFKLELETVSSFADYEGAVDWALIAGRGFLRVMVSNDGIYNLRRLNCGPFFINHTIRMLRTTCVARYWIAFEN